MQRLRGVVSWLDPGTRLGLFLQGFAGGLLIVIILPAILAIWSPKIRAKAGRAAMKLSFLLPSTADDGAGGGWFASPSPFARNSSIADSFSPTFILGRFT